MARSRFRVSGFRVRNRAQTRPNSGLFGKYLGEGEYAGVFYRTA